MNKGFIHINAQTADDGYDTHVTSVYGQDSIFAFLLLASFFTGHVGHNMP